MEGPHTRENIASHILVFLKDFNLENKVFCITADNASNNKSMARQLSIQVRQFNFEEHLLGSIGHIIHLAAKQGLKALGLCKPPTNVDTPEESNNNDQSDVNEYAPDLDSLPSVPGTIMFLIHSIVIPIRSSPREERPFKMLQKSPIQTKKMWKNVEAQRYFQEAVIDVKERPQMFWKSKEKIFPTLAAMARDVLAVPATSTSSERAFSRGKLIIDLSRSCLSPEKIRALMCLSSWLKCEFLSL
jgi:hypothetical protein